MSKEKQIEAEILEKILDDYEKEVSVEFPVTTYDLSRMIIENGYSKQSEGEWISNSEKFSNIYDSFYCSNCKNYTTERNPYRLGKYCSFCGAQMNGVQQVFNKGGFESKALKGDE